MAKLPGSFNTKDVDGRMGEFKAIPNGEYRVKIKDSERKITKETANLPKSQQVGYYALTIEVLEGEYKGRTVWVNLNLEHAKENVREIAERELASICDACGKVSINDTSELHGIEFTAKIGVKAATAQFGESNKIVAYIPLKGAKKPVISSDDDDDEPTKAATEEVKKPVRKVSFN